VHSFRHARPGGEGLPITGRRKRAVAPGSNERAAGFDRACACTQFRKDPSSPSYTFSNCHKLDFSTTRICDIHGPNGSSGVGMASPDNNMFRFVPGYGRTTTP
jgi:hypothetical protein